MSRHAAYYCHCQKVQLKSVLSSSSERLTRFSKLKLLIQGVPHLHGFHYRWSQYRSFCLMYSQVGDFRVSRGPPTVLLMQLSCNKVFFKSQNPCKEGTLFSYVSLPCELSLKKIQGVQNRLVLKKVLKKCTERTRHGDGIFAGASGGFVILVESFNIKNIL